MVKAASLIYAIFLSLLIGILCYGVTLIFSLNRNLEHHFDLKKRMLLENQSGLAYLSTTIQDVESSFGIIEVNGFEEGIVTSAKLSTWGLFKIGTVVSVANKDSVISTFLIAYKQHKKAPALYLRDSDEPLKISGTTKIKGDIYISSRGVKKVNITENFEINNPQHLGRERLSEKIIPIIRPIGLTYPNTYETRSVDDIEGSSIVNDFNAETLIVEAATYLENIKLKGNIIVRSKDTLYVSQSARLEDIIIDAPKVVFKDGFEGIVQVFATSEIVAERNVQLKYPSALILNSEGDEEASIICREGVRIEGAMLLFGNGLVSEEKNAIVIEPQAEVVGEVYCDGKLSLYGRVVGSVYTSALFHKTNTTQYDTMIYNGTIDVGNEHEWLFQTNLLEKFSSEEPQLLKKL